MACHNAALSASDLDENDKPGGFKNVCYLAFRTFLSRVLSFRVMDPFLFFIPTPLGKDEYNMRKGDIDTNRLVIWSIF